MKLRSNFVAPNTPAVVSTGLAPGASETVSSCKPEGLPTAARLDEVFGLPAIRSRHTPQMSTLRIAAGDYSLQGPGRAHDAGSEVPIDS